MRLPPPRQTPRNGRAAKNGLLRTSGQRAEEAVVKALSGAGAFCDADSRLLQLVVRASRPLLAAPFQVIVRAGEQDDTLWILLQGELEVLDEGDRRGQIRNETLYGPELLGLANTLGLCHEWGASVQTLTSCELRTIGGSAFRDILRMFPDDEAYFYAEARASLEDPAALVGTTRSKSRMSADSEDANAMHRPGLALEALQEEASWEAREGEAAPLPPTDPPKLGKRWSVAAAMNEREAPIDVADPGWSPASPSGAGPRSRALAPPLAAAVSARGQRPEIQVSGAYSWEESPLAYGQPMPPAGEPPQCGVQPAPPDGSPPHFGGEVLVPRDLTSRQASGESAGPRPSGQSSLSCGAGMPPGASVEWACASLNEVGEPSGQHHGVKFNTSAPPSRQVSGDSWNPEWSKSMFTSPDTPRSHSVSSGNVPKVPGLERRPSRLSSSFDDGDDDELMEEKTPANNTMGGRKSRAGTLRALFQGRGIDAPGRAQTPSPAKDRKTRLTAALLKEHAVRTFKDEDEEYDYLQSHRLGNFQKASGVPVTALQNLDEENAEETLQEELVEIEKKGRTSAIAELLGHPDPSVRAAAAMLKAGTEGFMKVPERKKSFEDVPAFEDPILPAASDDRLDLEDNDNENEGRKTVKSAKSRDGRFPNAGDEELEARQLQLLEEVADELRRGLDSGKFRPLDDETSPRFTARKLPKGVQLHGSSNDRRASFHLFEGLDNRLKASRAKATSGRSNVPEQ